MILIVGANGGMGSRYRAILNSLNVEWLGVDADITLLSIKEIAKKSSGIIIATPTDTHYEFLKLFSTLKKPVFCEKPLSRSLSDLNDILQMYEGHGLTMAYQYSELLNPDSVGASVYNYFKHGSDGMAWDCIQIIGLAKGAVTLQGISPIWDCQINGQQLLIHEMDMAYIKNIMRWLKGETMDLHYLYDIHKKVAEYENSKSN